MTPIGPASNSYFSQRMRLNYVDWGNHDAPPLILLHGGRDHCRNWDWTAEALREKYHIIAPDLRGHGDSAWASDGNYPMLAYIYDLKQLIDQMDLAPVTIIAHSMGGNIAIRYAGLYPEKVKKLVAIEGLGPSPKVQAEFEAQGVANRLRGWMETKQKYADIAPRRYKDFDAALTRMKTENPHLSSDQVRHLTVHAVVRNEDGSYSWKFDPLMRNWWPHDLPAKATQDMWRAITCPTLMLYGADSWASNPVTDGRIAHFGDNVEVREFERAGHWLHHDQFALFMETLEGFL